MSLVLLLAGLLPTAAEDGTSSTSRYMRAGKDGAFVLESRVTEETKDGVTTTYTSLTDRGSEKMTLTLRFAGKNQLRAAQAVQENKKGKHTVEVTFKEKEATLTRQGKAQQLKVTPDVVVTTAPDWSDIFQVIRRYDQARGGQQKFAGLWIHPVNETRQLTFTVEDTDKEEEISPVGDAKKKVKLKRYRVTLRSGAYLVWADRTGRVYRLMPPGRPGAAVVLEGYEKATSGLR